MKPRPKINVNMDLIKKVTGNIMNPKSNDIKIPPGTTIGTSKSEYDPSDKLLTIKSVTNTGYKIILSDGSQWTKMKKSFFNSEYTVGAVVKVLLPSAPGLKSQGARTIEIQNKAHTSDHWYFDGYVKK